MSSMTATANTSARASRKVQTGIVISDRMQKTIVVRVDRLVRHALYTRVVRRAATFQAHDETNSAKIGDLVKIMETRPLSKNKRWRLVEILRRGAVEVKPREQTEPSGSGTAS